MFASPYSGVSHMRGTEKRNTKEKIGHNNYNEHKKTRSVPLYISFHVIVFCANKLKVRGLVIPLILKSVQCCSDLGLPDE